MKLKIIFTVIIAVLSLFLFSCNSMPLDFSSSQSWYMAEKGTSLGTIKLAGVSVDRSGGWDSLEKEVAALAPIYFWKQGFRFVDSSVPAAYAAHISLREREYAVGWRSRRSLALEVRIWNSGGGSAEELSGRLPLAAGRVVVIGNRSFSSSGTTGKMLSRAIHATAVKLSADRRGD